MLEFLGEEVSLRESPDFARICVLGSIDLAPQFRPVKRAQMKTSPESEIPGSSKCRLSCY